MIGRAVSEAILILSAEIRRRNDYIEAGGPKNTDSPDYWCKCFIAAAQRMMKNPIHKAAR